MNRKAQMSRLENKLAINPNDLQVLRRLVTLLDPEAPAPRSSGRITSAHYAIAANTARDWPLPQIDPARFAATYHANLETLAQAGIRRCVPIGQVFSGQAHKIQDTHTHCDARLEFFKETKAIPSLCHACYKVQILPESLTAMFQTYVLLLSLDLPNDNTRKCMIELREGIKYPYKAYIYCESVEDALACLAAFRAAQIKAGVSGAGSKISHGCSEYGVEYPAFKFSGGRKQPFETPPHWSDIEKEHFDKIDLPVPQRTSNTKPHQSLRDMFVFRTWIRYAELIGDQTSAQYSPRKGPDLPDAFSQRVNDQVETRHQERTELLAPRENA